MSAFHNNLEKNDRVLHVPTGRQAKVARSPRSPETQRMTSIIFDGKHDVQYVDVMDLRLIPDGRTPEEHAPIDGTPPEGNAREFKARKAPVSAAAPASGLDALQSERHALQVEMRELEEKFRAKKARLTLVEKAIDVLEGK